MKSRKHIIRHVVLAILLLLTVGVQITPSWGKWYAISIYPAISYLLTFFSSHIPFSLGDLFITLSIFGLIIYPIYVHRRYHFTWKKIMGREGEYLLWIYVWFYMAWGLNYSQPDFYKRTHISRVAYTSKGFNSFVNQYVKLLNATYCLPPKEIDKSFVHKEVTRIYRQISDSLQVHAPQHDNLSVKTMLFSNFISSMGVSGYMGPFFCEFNLNGNILPVDYPATYAHEMAHLLGITSEAEANFYAYQVCTRSKDQNMRFSGYFFIMGYVLRNARLVMNDKQFDSLRASIRPEVKRLYNFNHFYWRALYSPVLGTVQDWIYDIYLKGNKIENGQMNYFQVVSLLISYEQSKK